MNVPTIKQYPVSPDRIPQEIVSAGKYEIRMANTLEELDQILALRYRVFNVEMGEGLESSEATQRDLDDFDAQCHHLMVCLRDTGEVVGTYRMQTREMAEAGIGFYSSGEYDLSPFGGEVLDAAVEIGRACIEKAHRNGRVLFLLFKGLIRYLVFNDKRYMLGCCSITSQDPQEGLRMHQILTEQGHVHPRYNVLPQEGFECELSPMTVMTSPNMEIPRLMRIYFLYGAKICSPPAIDRLFKTIDFITLIDIQEMDAKSYNGFME